MPTVVSRWFTLWATAVPAFKRSAAAVMSWSESLAPLTSASASRVLPAVAVMLTEPRLNSISPTVTSVAASRRAVALAPVLKIRLVALCVIEPVPATTSMLPLAAAVLVVRMSAVPVNDTLRAAITLMLPLPLAISALAVMSLVVLPAATPASIKMLPLPWALTAVSSAGAVPLPSVIEPAVVRSTMAPLPPVVRTSLCAASLVVVRVPPSLPTRLTLTATSSTLKASASSTKMPPLAARALRVPTVVSRWFTLWATAVPALSLKPAARMSWSPSLVVVTASASKMLPAVAVMLTVPVAKVMSPTVTLVAASSRAVALAPVLSSTLLALCVIEPVPASRSMLPLPATVLAVRTSASAAKLKVRAARTLTLPLVLEISALTVMSVPAPRVCKSTLPVPWLLTATPSVLPSLSVKLPAVVRSTMALLPALVRKSNWLLISVPLAPVLLRRLTVTVRLSTTRASVSSTNTPPLPAAPEKVATVVSNASADVPTPPAAPACTKRLAALTSTSASASPSMIEPPAISATLPEL